MKMKLEKQNISMFTKTQTILVQKKCTKKCFKEIFNGMFWSLPSRPTLSRVENLQKKKKKKKNIIFFFFFFSIGFCYDSIFGWN